MIMQISPKGKQLKELDICFQIIILFLWGIYFNKYLSKVATKTVDAKIKIDFTKNSDKGISLVIADVNLMAKEIQKHKCCHNK